MRLPRAIWVSSIQRPFTCLVVATMLIFTVFIAANNQRSAEASAALQTYMLIPGTKSEKAHSHDCLMHSRTLDRCRLDSCDQSNLSCRPAHPGSRWSTRS